MRLLIFGYGYCGAALAARAASGGWDVMATQRQPRVGSPGIDLLPFDAAGPAIARATHILVTAGPGSEGDPVLARYAPEVAAAPALRWVGYMSTTGIYGDRGGGWVDELTAPAPTAERSVRRLAAELAWREVRGGAPLDLLRTAGIYGPGRSALDDVRSGRARRVLAPGHLFGRIHRDDIVSACLAAMTRPPVGSRVLHLSDDLPAASADVIAEAARLLGVAPPPAVDFATAWAGMGEMARSFWAENRKVRSQLTQMEIGYSWRYPTYIEGLAAILAEERADQAG